MDMDSAVIVTTLGGALSAMLGVLVGGVVTRRVQERHWLRDKQLKAYEELFTQYARFMMTLRRAHLGRTPADVDWNAWSVALVSASLVAPLALARAIDDFGQAIAVLSRAGRRPRPGPRPRRLGHPDAGLPAGGGGASQAAQRHPPVHGPVAG